MKKFLVLIALVSLLLCGCNSTASIEETTFPLTTGETTTPPTIEETTVPPTTEEPTTQPEPEDTDFVRIIDYIPSARESLAYATVDNFTGVKIYDFTAAYLRYGTLKKLMAASQLLEAQGYGLVIWDAYRPVYGQERLWEAYPDPAYVSKPGTGSQSHCRGLAVDVTLYDLATGELLKMPTDFDDFTAYADRDYRDNSETAAANATLLEEIMK